LILDLIMICCCISSVILLILSLGYFGITHQGIFTEHIPIIQEKKVEKYQKSTLATSKIEAINRQLLKVMQTEKHYLNPN